MTGDHVGDPPGTPTLIERHDAVLCDLDGVVYRGRDAVPGSARAVAAARGQGVTVVFVTNNASRTPHEVAAHLSRLGVPAEPADVVTSAQAAARLVAGTVPPGSAVLVVGGEGLRVAVAERGLRPVDSADDDPAAVVQGWSPDVGWRALAEATHAVRAGLPWIASNLDVTVPTARGLAPGNGSLVEVVALATGRRPTSAGKPDVALHAEAVERAGSRAPLVVGDRLDTDIAGANRAGAAGLLVLSGVTRPVDVVLAPPAHRPTHVAEDLLTGLTGPVGLVEEDDGGTWRCGGWRAGCVDGVPEVAGGGGPVDGLRALCAAVWHGEQPVPRDVVESVVDDLWR